MNVPYPRNVNNVLCNKFVNEPFYQDHLHSIYIDMELLKRLLPDNSFIIDRHDAAVSIPLRGIGERNASRFDV